VPRLHIAN
jgi:hypothetical protein